MLEQFGTQHHVDPIGGMGKQIRPQPGQHDFETRYRQQTHRQHIQCRHAMMHQHFVDNDLKEQRRHQRKQLQKKRRHQDFQEQFFIFDQSRYKPADIKLPS